MSNPTVAEYIVRRLSDLGVDKAFGVPSDYAFPIADAIEASSDMDWVGCTSELNAAYAVDGYARLKGAGLLCAAYGAYIEVMIPESESVPLPADVLDAMYKLKTPTP